jgi:uncharacterized membrane protein
MLSATVRFYDIVLAVHIIAVVIAFGITFVYPLIIPLTARTSPQNLPWLHRMQGEIGQKIITPFATLVLIAGIYLVADSDTWKLSDWWVSWGFAAIIILLGLGGAFFAPRERKLAELAERDFGAGGAGAPSAEYEALGKQVGMVGALSSLLVVATVVIMTMGSRGAFL